MFQRDILIFPAVILQRFRNYHIVIDLKNKLNECKNKIALQIAYNLEFSMSTLAYMVTIKINEDII